MLRKIKISNFRSIASAELDLGRVNLFVGPNGGGKTNVLEAIGIVSAALGRSVSPEDLDLRGVRLSLPRLFKSTFKNRKIPRFFALEAVTDHLKYKFTLGAGDSSQSLAFQQEKLEYNGKTVFGRSPRGFSISTIPVISPEAEKEFEKTRLATSRGLFDQFKMLLAIPESATAQLEHLSTYAIYAPQTALLRGMAVDPRPVTPLGLTGGRLATAVHEVMEHIAKDYKEINAIYSILFEQGAWANRIRVAPPRPDVVPPQVPSLPEVVYFVDKYMHAKRAWLSAYDSSEGALYLLFVATLLAHKEAPRIFSLDNVDGTLNPGLVRALIRHVLTCLERDKSDRQIFMTSHNPTALDELDLFNDDHTVHVVHRNAVTGYTEFERIRPNPGMTRDDWIREKDGRKLSNLYLDGLIPYALG